jgi:acyl-CoA synthetase (AMP-forming)/AMP-acid ligase II
MHALQLGGLPGVHLQDDPVGHVDGSAGPLPRPVRITTAGAPPSPTTIAEMERMGFTVVHVYGLTETYGPFTVCQPQPHWAGLPAGQRAALQARQGVAMVTAGGLRVVDDEMADVSADGQTMGEIVMRGNTVMAGYYLDPEATAETFRGGWFHSGDLGVMFPDAYIQLRDRAKDIVISGGENISTIEVEQALMSHPYVLEAAVVGAPDEKWGERPKAYVVLRAGTSATQQDLIAHVKTKIAGYKAPRDIAITMDLPKTSTGKIQKYMLREADWAGHASRVNG